MIVPEQKRLSRELEAVDPFDKEDKRSLWHRAPSAIVNMMKVMPHDLLKMSDEEMQATGEIGEIERRLRHSFWYEYNLSLMHDEPIRINNIFQGVCRRDYFQSVVLQSAMKMAYIITPPLAYKVAVEEMLDLAMKEMREILLLDNTHYNERGKKTVNTQLVGLKYKIFETLSGRVHGNVARNIKVEAETKSLSVNVNQGTSRDVIDIDGRAEKALLEDAETRRLREIDNRIKELERLIGEAPNAVSEKEEGPGEEETVS